jgi:hypothetical protein
MARRASSTSRTTSGRTTTVPAGWGALVFQNTWRVADPVKAVTEVEGYVQALYRQAQLAP